MPRPSGLGWGSDPADVAVHTPRGMFWLAAFSSLSFLADGPGCILHFPTYFFSYFFLKRQIWSALTST